MREKEVKMNDLLEQIINMEEEIEQLRQENRFLKEEGARGTKLNMNAIVDQISCKIDSSTSQILEKIGAKEPEQRATGHQPIYRQDQAPLLHHAADLLREINRDSVNLVKTEIHQIKHGIATLENELKELFSLLYDMNEEIKEKTQRISVYAAINEKLTQIKEEYVRIRQNMGNI